MLRNNDLFPSLSFARAGGGDVHLPGDVAGGFGVILIYRGAWSAACTGQLEAFSRAADMLADAGIHVAAVSVDDRETAEAFVAKHKLGFPVAYGADARAVSAVAGIPINEDAVSFEASGFVLDPDGRIALAVYSTFDAADDRIVTATYSDGVIGRLMPEEVLRVARANAGRAPADRSGVDTPAGRTSEQDRDAAE